MFRFTKIGATIGPSSNTKPIITAMVKAGMNFARLNFSHGTYQTHEQAFKLIREVEKETGEIVSIMQDLRGLKIRVGVLPPEGVSVKDGQIITFNIGSKDYKNDELPLDYPDLDKQLKPGERILIDDGKLEGKIINIEANKIYLEIVQGGTIFSNKGLNFPDSKLKMLVINSKDKDDLRFGLTLGIDLLAISFVNSAQDIISARVLISELLKEIGKENVLAPTIIAKIERHDAVENLAEILNAADGIMVARGDLGLELPEQEVPLIQKKIIDAANAAAKPVIVATQMLDSMQTSRRPTRAEVSDVANAVIDHADALLLTNETAAGEFPVETVKTMAEIIVTTEKSKYDDTKLPGAHKKGTTIEVAITELSRMLAEEVKAKLILAASLTGETGRLISHVRPNLPILVATENIQINRQLNLSWGVKSFILLPCKTIEELVERSIVYIKEQKLAKAGDKMIIVAGEPVGIAGNVNLVEVREIF